MKIQIEKPTPEKINELNVYNWPIWEKEPSVFDWHYDATEVCYILEGRVTVESKDQKVELGNGDLVTFPAGLDCVWHVREKVRKHYKFE